MKTMKPSVLLASGDLVFRDEVKKSARDLCVFSVARTMDEAVSSIQREGWNVIILDIKLPDLDGLQVLHALRHAPALPTIMITAGLFDVSGNLGVLDLPKLISLHRRPESIVTILRAVLDPSAERKIHEVQYLPTEDAFFVAFRNGKTYELSRKTIEADDRSPVVKTRVVDDGDAFVVRQASGNTYDVAWDFVLYHQEPTYPYYKQKQQQTDAKRAQRIGERIRLARQNRNWTLDVLAERTGIQVPNLSRLESGKHLPSLPTLERVADALGIAVAQLLAA